MSLPTPDLLLLAFSLGLLGSGHCLAMCGGIAGALGMQGGAGGGAVIGAMPLHAVGRLASYGALGSLAGGFGGAVLDLVPHAAVILRTVAGAFLVAMGLYVAGLWRGLVVLERVGRPVFAQARALANGAPGPFAPMALGLAWGLLPCGLVYSTLAWSVSAGGSAAGGALLMIAFGLGTLPMVSGVALLGAPLGGLLRAPAFRRWAGATIVAFGLWTLATGGSIAASIAYATTEDPVTFDCIAGVGTPVL